MLIFYCFSVVYKVDGPLVGKRDGFGEVKHLTVDTSWGVVDVAITSAVAMLVGALVRNVLGSWLTPALGVEAREPVVAV